MKPKHSAGGTVVCMLFAFSTLSFNSAYAQPKVSTVTGLTFNGQPVTQSRITVLLPGMGGNKSMVNRGDELASGTKLIIPPKTVVLLQSHGGRQRIEATLNNPVEYSVDFTDKGENHNIKGEGGKISNSVTHLVGYAYWNTNERGTTAASAGTEFSFTDFSDKDHEQAKISTTEGVIRIFDEVPCLLNGAPVKNQVGGTATKSNMSRQSKGDKEFTSSDEPVEYKNFENAIKIVTAYKPGWDKESWIYNEAYADDDMCLGNLYMMNNQPENAIKPFEQAFKYYNAAHGKDDDETIEARLSWAKALIKRNDPQGAAELDSSIHLLEINAAGDEKDLKFLKQHNGVGQDIICEGLMTTYAYLAAAYAIKDDSKKSNKYLMKSCTDSKY